MFKEKCAGAKQSPINITTASVKETNISILGPLKLENDWKPNTGKPTFTLLNKNGKTVQLNIKIDAGQEIKTKQHGKIWSTNSDRQISVNFLIVTDISSPHSNFRSKFNFSLTLITQIKN